ncbi:MAG: hypothetical protein ACREO7_10505 [Pseudoxanthomonas sp.]
MTAASASDERRQLLASLLSDHEWKYDPPTRARLEVLQQCLQPTVPPDSHDFGCPAETEWTLLANEIERYLDFRRLRHVEAQLQHFNDADFHFDRSDWEVAHEAEAALAAHLRHVHEESYVPEQADSYLRVH